MMSRTPETTGAQWIQVVNRIILCGGSKPKSPSRRVRSKDPRPAASGTPGGRQGDDPVPGWRYAVVGRPPAPGRRFTPARVIENMALRKFCGEKYLC